MNDEISKLKQQIFYEKVLKKIFNIIDPSRNNIKEKLENPEMKLDCEATEHYNNIFSQIRVACLVSKRETFPSGILDINPNDLKSELGKKLKIQRL